MFKKFKLKLSHRKRLWLFRSLRFIFAATIAFFICQFDLNYLEFLTYDLRYQLKPTAPTSGLVQTVAIDAKTIETLGRSPNAKDHIQFIKNLIKAKPRVVVYTLNPENIVGAYDELEQFATEANYTRFYYGANILVVKGLESEVQLKPPLNTIETVPGPKTTDTDLFGKDSVTRRLIFSFQGNKTIHPILASEINGLTDSEYQGLFDFLDSKQTLIDFRPTGTYKHISFLNILKNTDPNPNITDKIVLVGEDNLISAKDYIRTPYSRNITAMSILEMHANIFDTLILNRAPIPAGKWVDLIITILIATLTIFVVLQVRPAKGLGIILFTMITYLILSYLLLAGLQINIETAHPLLAIFICYYFFIPYRLIIENRRSWEYYHKNKLLTQVEELKSNFLRMMSHDLKTPLARIQGMTDIVLNDKAPLSPSQTEAIITISKSSEELTEFIGSILNLGRIESKDIKLDVKSKDINSILKTVIKKLEYLAAKKHIQIITEYDPLFSIRIDEDLMKQVFTNLIENAIKYSPEKSKVLITTEEIDNKIIVQISDQGIGIPKSEIENVFSKFYRSKEVTNTDIKGSGLGLYLAHYFVDLHDGQILVESEVNKGSTFSVELPMELDA